MEAIDRTNTELLAKAKEVLRLEFSPKKSKEEHESGWNFLKFGLKDLERDQLISRGGEMFATTGADGQAETVSQIKYYRWLLISPQLFFYPTFENGSISKLSLKPLRDIVRDLNLSDMPIGLATELSYSWVRPDLRNKGYGKNIFEGRLQWIKQNVSQKHNIYVFATARGISADSSKGPDLLKYMLQQEQEANGSDENGTITVKGIQIPMADLSKKKQVSEDWFEIRPESRAIKHLAENSGMQFVGYARNLSPTFGTIFPQQ